MAVQEVLYILESKQGVDLGKNPPKYNSVNFLLETKQIVCTKEMNYNFTCNCNPGVSTHVSI